MDYLVNLIIRPERDVYEKRDLGPEIFQMNDEIYIRKDLTLINNRGYILECSWFMPAKQDRMMPWVVYWHGNWGSRIDSYEIVESCLPLHISVFTFDFSGSGLSQGDYVSLGYYESHDIRWVVDFIRSSGVGGEICLFGRSMGAASILKYAKSDQSLAWIVLDSAFSSLEQVCYDIGASYHIIPRWLVDFSLKYIRKRVIEIAEFDIMNVVPSQDAQGCTMPALFLHATSDSLVNISHMARVYENYTGDKAKMEIPGDHNTTRATHVYKQIASYLQRWQVSVKIKRIPIVRRLQTEEVDDEEERGDTTIRGGLPNMTRYTKQQIDHIRSNSPELTSIAADTFIFE